MSDLLPVVAEVARTMAPEARALAEAVGAIDASRTRSIVNSLSDGLYLRCEERRAVMFTEAAARLKAAGVPAQAVADPVLHAILTHGSLQEDPALQDLWINLLCNAAISAAIPPAFPEILRQLEPIEARFLELVDRHQAQVSHRSGIFVDHIDGVASIGSMEWRHLDNLARLQVLEYGRTGPMNVKGPTRPFGEFDVMASITPLGIALLQACRVPGSTVSHKADRP